MIKNKKGWIKIVEAFIAVFIIMSVAIFVVNKSYIERRDISEKIYGIEIQLLQEIIDEFGNIKFNDPNNSPDEEDIGNFIYGGEDITKSRVPEYLDCGVAVCDISLPNCDYTSKDPSVNDKGEVIKDVYAQILPIVETDTSLRIECWIK